MSSAVWVCVCCLLARWQCLLVIASCKQASILAQAKIDTQMLGAHIEHTRTPTTHQNSSQH